MSSEVRRTAIPRTAEEERDRLLAVLQVQADLQDLFIRNGADRAWWDAALRKLIALSESAFGFLGRIEHGADGAPYLHSLAVTDIAWNEWSRQVFDEFAAQGLEFRNLDSLFGVTVATGEVVVSDDPATDPRRCGLPPGHPPLDGYIGIPLHDGDTLIGMVGLANRPGGYDPSLIDDLRPVLSVVTHMVGRAMAEQRAAEAVAEVRELGTAVEHLTRTERDRRAVDHTIHRILGGEHLADAVVPVDEVLEALAPGMTGLILSENPDDPSEVCDCAVRPPGSPCTEIHRDECIALLSGRTHVSLPGIRIGSCAHADPMDALTICTPIATATAEYGLLVSRTREMPGADATARAGAIAESVERVASALAQVALRTDLASRALRDALTGLPNREALMQAVERRMARIDAAARPFAVVIVDVDDFKDVNDQLGHAVGDEVLIEVGAALQGAVRESDVVARLGGDEFVVILCSGDQDTVRQAGERMIAEIAAIEPRGGPGLSASAGAVMVGWSDGGWEDAYRAADACLYAAKSSGKNQVMVGGLLGTAEQA